MGGRESEWEPYSGYWQGAGVFPHFAFRDEPLIIMGGVGHGFLTYFFFPGDKALAFFPRQQGTYLFFLRQQGACFFFLSKSWLPTSPPTMINGLPLLVLNPKSTQNARWSKCCQNGCQGTCGSSFFFLTTMRARNIKIKEDNIQLLLNWQSS